jgi:uncharacterized RDD family membrane protein YckC
MSQLSINTTQNVKINFTAASAGHRILSFLIDSLIQIAYMILIGWGVYGGLGLGYATDSMDPWSQAAIGIILYFPVIVYSIFFESILEGQTIGKQLVKIKVVKIDGFQASFGDYFIRWIFRLVDIFSFSGLVGLITILTSKKSQRLGDLSAGTAVISLKNDITINSTILQEIGAEYKPMYPLVIKLTDNDVRIIKENYQNALILQDNYLLKRLRQKIESVTSIVNQNQTDKEFINTIIRDYNFYTRDM